MKNCCENDASKSVLMVSPVAFGRLWQRHQSLALEFAKNDYNVFYLQPLLSGGFSVFSSDYLLKMGNKIKVITCKVPFKASSYPSLNMISAKFALTLLKKEFKFVPNQTLLWISEPSLAFFTKIKWKKAVYDRCDLHGAFPGQKKEVWKKYENEIFKNVDLLVASHPYLINGVPESLKSFVVKNASSDKFINYRKVKNNNKMINLVSCGAHYEWTDFDWLSSLIKQENVVLHIVGSGRGRKFTELINNPKVVYHGQVDHDELPALLGIFDVGLVPFKNIDLINGVDPIKVYEYAAVGLIIWAPDVKALKGNPFIDYFIKTSEPKKLIANENRLNINVPTWSERIKPIISIM